MYDPKLDEDGVQFALSMNDLFMVDGFRVAFESQNVKVFEAILQNNGMDVSIGYELVHCEHRTLTGKVYNGIRIEGFERLDDAWIKTGAATMEAQIKSIKDIHLRHDLRKMQAAGCASAEANKQASKHYE